VVFLGTRGHVLPLSPLHLVGDAGVEVRGCFKTPPRKHKWSIKGSLLLEDNSISRLGLNFVVVCDGDIINCNNRL